MTELLEEKLSLIKEDVTSFVGSCKTVRVIDETTEDSAVNMLQQVKARAKRIEELRKEFTAPLSDQVKKINGMFKAQSEPLEQAESILKGALKIYLDEQERIAYGKAEELRKQQEVQRVEEMAKLEDLKKKEAAATNLQELSQIKKLKEQAEMAIAAPAQMIEQPRKTIRNENGSVTRKKVWKWEVTDEAILRKEHPELFILDEKAVNKLVQDGERGMLGLKIYQESELSVSV